MKNRSILILLLLSASFAGYSQAKQTQLEPSKSLTIDDVNRTSGVPATMINGKPYSQYKAEQALKQQASNKVALNKTSNSGLINVAPQSTGVNPNQSKTGPDQTAEKTEVKTEPVVLRQVDANAAIPVKPDFAKGNANNTLVGSTQPVDAKPEISNKQSSQTLPPKEAVAEPGMIKTQTIAVQTGNVPPSVLDNSKGTNVNSNGATKEVKPVEQKTETVQPGNSPGAKTKTE